MKIFVKLAILAQVVFLINSVAGTSYGGGALGGMEGGHGYGHKYHGHHSIPLAVHSGHHHVETIPTHSSHYAKTTYVDVPAGYAPIHLNFQSQSSPMQLSNHHVSAPGSVQHSHSIDEPHKLYHQVTKPVYQEIHEIVVPHRKIVQTVQPVSEEIKTIVHKKEHGYSGGNGGGGYGGGYGKY